MQHSWKYDTMEYDKYYLISRDFDKKNKKKPISFSIKQIWDKKIEKNYKMIRLLSANGFASISWAKKNGLRKLRPF